jgi:hypothetical protein
MLRAVRVGTEMISFANQLSQMIFDAISSTHKEFQQVFRDPQMSSSFVMWAMELLDYFGTIFCRHVYAPDIESDIRAQCLQIALQHCLVVSRTHSTTVLSDFWSS